MQTPAGIRLLSVIVAVIAVGSAGVADDPPRVSPQVDAVLDVAAQTGAPVLAVAGYADCAACKSLRQRLATEPLAAEFLRLDLTIGGGSQEWRAWQKFTDTNARSSPQLFVVRADGKVLHAGAAPRDVAALLRTLAQQAGPALGPRQVADAEKIRERAQTLADAGDKPGALRELAPSLGSPSQARAVVAARKFAETLGAELGAAVEAAPETFSDDADGMAAAVCILAISKDCGSAAPDMAKAATRKLAALRRNPANAALLKQAEQIHAADSAARKSVAKGRPLYEKIVAQHPGTAAAALAEVRLEKRAAAPAE